MDLGSLLEYDMTGFNGTYWKFISSPYYDYRKYDVASDLIGEDILYQYDKENSVIDIFFAFTNFEIFEAKVEDIYNYDEVRFYEDSFTPSSIGTATVVINGDKYRTSLSLGSYYSQMLVAEGTVFCFDDANSGYNCYISYYVDDDSDEGIKIISEEEYKKAVAGDVIDVSERDKSEMKWNEDKLYNQDYHNGVEQSFDYSVVYGKVLDKIDDTVEYGSYCLWDLNQDGILELIVGHGEYSANYINDVWTVDDGGSVLNAGMFYGEQIYCEAPDGNGIYVVYGHMENEVITRITLKNNEIAEEEISDRELSSEEEAYYNDKEIYCVDITNRSLLEQY